VLLLTLGVVVSSWLAIRATRAEHEQNRLRRVAQLAQQNESLQRQAAEREGLATLRQAYNSEMNLAQQALLTHNYGRTVALLDRHRPRPDKPDLRQWEWRYFWNQSRSEATFTLPSHADYIVRTIMSPDGRYLLSCDKQGTLRLWDLTEQGLVMTLSESGFNARAFAFSADGARLALTCRDGKGGARVEVRSVPSNQVLTQFTHDREIQALIFAQDDTGLLIADQDMTLHAWDFDSAMLRRQVPGKPDEVLQARRAAFSLDGQCIAMADQVGRIRLFDVATGAEKAQMTAFEGDIASLVFSPDGKLLAVSPWFTGISTDIKVFSTESGQERMALAGHGSWIPALTFTPDGKRLISAGADQTIRVWDLDSARELTRLHGHLSEVYAIAVSPDGKRIVSGCKDGTLFGWDIDAIKHQSQFETLPVPVRSLEFLPAGAGILSVNVDGTVTCWDSVTLQAAGVITALGDNVRRLLVSPDGRHVFTGTGNGQLKVLDWASKQVVREVVCDPNQRTLVDLIGFLDQGRILVVVTAYAEIRLLDTRSWQSRVVTVSSDARLYRPTPVLSPDERLLIYVGRDEAIHVLDLPNATEKMIPTHQNWSVLDMAWSPDSRVFATSSGDGAVNLWEGADGGLVAVLSGHLLGVHAVAFSPDGQRVASGSKGEEAVKLWDVTTRHEVATLPGEGFLSSQLNFSSDGRLLGAVNSKGKALIWRAPLLREIEEIEKSQSRDEVHAKEMMETLP
jgi:WD40 repeat protein